MHKEMKKMVSNFIEENEVELKNIFRDTLLDYYDVKINNDPDGYRETDYINIALFEEESVENRYYEVMLERLGEYVDNLEE